MDASTLINSFRVDGKVAVVTVICVDILHQTAHQTAAEIMATGGVAEGIAVDVASRAEVDALANRVAHERGGIHVWANIAGIMVEGPMLDAPEEDLDRIIAVNLKGVFFGCQAAGRVMVDQSGGGSIINASSAAADVPSPNIVSYALCKAAVVQMTKTLAIEVGKRGVRVNAVAPGFVLTGMTGRYFIRPDGTVDEAMRDAVLDPMRKATPLRSIGEPEDIAAAVLYLASDAARFMTGQVVRPNGGVAMV